MKPPVFWLASSVIGCLVLVGGFYRYAEIQRATIVAAIPLRPPPTRMPAKLFKLLGDTETNLRNDWRPTAALVDLSQLYHANGFYREAMQCYQALEFLEPHEGKWLHLHATILAGFGEQDKALPLERQAVALSPNYLPAWLRLGDILVKSNRLSDAAATYNAILKQSPGHDYALLGLAQTHILVNDWSGARGYLEEAVAKHPGFSAGWNLLVTVYDNLPNQTLAAAARDRAKTSGPTREFSDPWIDALTEKCYDAYQLSVAAALSTDHGEARRWLERAIDLAPDSHFYQQQLGRLLFASEDYNQAQPHAEKAVSLAPDDSDSWALLLEIFKKAGNTAAMERTLHDALEHCPTSAYLHFMNAQRLRSQNRLEAALEELKIAKRYQPNGARAYIETAMILFAQSRVDDAIDEMKTAVAVEPGNRVALEVLARTTINSADAPAARHYIQLIRALSDVNPTDLAAIENKYQRQFGQRP